ncbi:MAG: hypothetical protein HZC43_05900 [Nitrosomonadales bacterium]|nr:hypothetical protein [Nitrosomonadales bacterium]
MGQLFALNEQIRGPDAAIAKSAGFGTHSRITLRFIRAARVVPARQDQEVAR